MNNIVSSLKVRHEQNEELTVFQQKCYSFRDMGLKRHKVEKETKIKRLIKNLPETHTSLLGDLKRLEELEQKYGQSWVNNKYFNEPDKSDKWYPFALRMHKAMLYRRSLGKMAPQVLSVPHNTTEFQTLSDKLRWSITGYNGTRNGKTALTPEEFYAKWLKRKKNKKHTDLVKEGEAKRDAVLWLIGKLLNSSTSPQPLPSSSTPQVKTPKPKKQREPKVIIPHGITADILAKEHDVYYTDGGTLYNGTPRQVSRIAVFKNGDLFHEKNIGNKTNNEAEYHALIVALKDIKRCAVIYTDSQLMVKTFLGEWQAKEPRLITLRDEARKLMTENIAIEWKPREENIAGFYLEENYQI